MRETGRLGGMLRGGAGPLLALALLLGIAAPGAGQSPADGPSGVLYVPNQADATVSIIDLGRREVVETVDLQALGYPPDAKPHDVVAAPDGSAWYVSLIGANTVVKFGPDGEVAGEASFEVPGMLALAEGGDVLWVGRSMSAVNPPPSIGRIETGPMTTGVVEVVFPRPHAIAAAAEGRPVHTASLSINRIASVSADGRGVELFEVPGPTHTLVQFAVSPDGGRIAATGQMTGKLLVFDRTKPDRLPLVAQLDVGTWPWHPVWTPDGRHVVFGNKKDDTVAIVDAESWEVAAVVEHPALSQPHGAAAGPDGRYVYVSNNNIDGAWTPEGWSGPTGEGEPGAGPPGSVTIVDLETEAVVGVIPVGRDPNGIGIAAGR